MSIENVITELEAQRDSITRAIEALNGRGQQKISATASIVGKQRGRRGPMSAAVKAKLARRMKEVWRARRATAKKTTNKKK